jgi:transcriptional regulator with XRE-family HTH domain
MDKVKMGNFLTSLRNEKNLRQQDEADIFQVSPQAISKWESGDSVPDIATLEKLSNFFNVGIDEIINGERKTPTTNVNTVVVARNPSLEERGIGKDYYAVFIYAMSALFLSLILAIIPYVFFYVGGVEGSPLYQEANLYEVLFRSSTWITILCWLMVLFFLVSTLSSIGLWLDKAHRKTYWNLSFAFALASMVFNLGAFLAEIAGYTTGFVIGGGCLILFLFGVAYFVLFCSLPFTRRSRFVPQNPQQKPVK